MSLFGGRFKVDYCGRKSFYDGAKDAYREGERVTLYFSLIATDTRYTFYLDDEEFNTGYEEGKGIVIDFVMPAHDVVLRCVSKNIMVEE